MFNRAYRGLASQGWQKSMMPDGETCAYRGQNGCKCAYGHVEDDDKALVEGKTVNQLATLGLGLAATLTPSMRYFARLLQSAHDRADSRSLEDRFRRFAGYHGLSIPRVRP